MVQGVRCDAKGKEKKEKKIRKEGKRNKREAGEKIKNKIVTQKKGGQTRRKRKETIMTQEINKQNQCGKGLAGGKKIILHKEDPEYGSGRWA